MKFVRAFYENEPRYGVLEGEAVYFLSKPPYDGLAYTGQSAPLAAYRLLAPSEPTKLVCVGKNYYDHAMEMGEGVPDHPILFMKGPNAVSHPGAPITAPAFVTRVDYEGELAVVIGRRAKDVPAERAGEYILGYTCLNDVTARIIQKADGQWTRGKAMDGFAPFGPWITDEVEPDDLAITTRLNGKVVQQSRTGLFMHKIPELVAFITASMTLEPGDVIATGTPAGIGPMGDGDRVEVEIEGIGTLENPVVLPHIKT